MASTLIDGSLKVAASGVLDGRCRRGCAEVGPGPGALAQPLALVSDGVGGAGSVASSVAGVDDGEQVLVGEALAHRCRSKVLVDLVGAKDLGEGDGAFHFVPDLSRCPRQRLPYARELSRRRGQELLLCLVRRADHPLQGPCRGRRGPSGRLHR